MTQSEKRWTPGPWGYVPSNENHGPYVVNDWGFGDICDCYVMSKPNELAVCNGGTSRPIHHQHDEADANARLIAAAPDMAEALELHIAYEALPTDRGGNAGPKGQAWARFIAARDAALLKAKGGA